MKKVSFLTSLRNVENHFMFMGAEYLSGKYALLGTNSKSYKIEVTIQHKTIKVSGELLEKILNITQNWASRCEIRISGF